MHADLFVLVGWSKGKRRKGREYPYVLQPQTRPFTLNNEGSGQSWTGHSTGCYQLLQWVCLGYLPSWGTFFLWTYYILDSRIRECFICTIRFVDGELKSHQLCMTTTSFWNDKPITITSLQKLLWMSNQSINQLHLNSQTSWGCQYVIAGEKVVIIS